MRYIKPTGFSEVTARLRKAEGWNDKRFAAPLADEPDEPSVIRTDSGATGEPVAWFCEWFNADGSQEWDQYHDRTDPIPAADEWEDRPPDRVTPLYTAPHPLVAPESWQALAETANRTLERAERRDARNADHELVAPKCPTPKGCEHNGLCRGRCITAQPARVPLTEAQIDKIFNADPPGGSRSAQRRIARAIEAAHGIGASDAKKV